MTAKKAGTKHQKPAVRQVVLKVGRKTYTVPATGVFRDMK